MKTIATSQFSDTIELDDLEVVVSRLPAALSRSARLLYIEVSMGDGPPPDDDPRDLADAILELWKAGLLELRTKEIP